MLTDLLINRPFLYSVGCDGKYFNFVQFCIKLNVCDIKLGFVHIYFIVGFYNLAGLQVITRLKNAY